jgi:hypothetical protein
VIEKSLCLSSRSVTDARSIDKPVLIAESSPNWCGPELT